jgi:hypothetical protein
MDHYSMSDTILALSMNELTNSSRPKYEEVMVASLVSTWVAIAQKDYTSWSPS